jgi:hypothetical protein
MHCSERRCKNVKASIGFGRCEPGAKLDILVKMLVGRLREKWRIDNNANSS